MQPEANLATSALLLERDGDIARLILNRPDQGNAIDMALAEALDRISKEVAADRDVRCVVLTAQGRLFCAGGDVTAFAAAGEGAGAFLLTLANALHRAIRTLATMPKPLLVAVNGPAAGAGLSLAALGDVVIASRSAHFTAAYSALGLTPDGGIVCRQNIWRRSRRRLAERGPRPGVDIKRRACGAASVGVRWSSV